EPPEAAGLTATGASASSGRWDWPLNLGFGEVFGPVPFATTDLTGVSLVGVAVCPDGNSPDPSAGCTNGAILPSGVMTPPPIPCSSENNRGAAALEACPTLTSTLFDASSVGKPLAVAAAVPPTWATALTARGFYVGFDDGTIQLAGDSGAQVV